jgi:hypothetical protein
LAREVWRCLHCKAVLGTLGRDYFGADTLNVKPEQASAVMFVGKTYAVHCRCGAVRVWRDGRLIVPRR